MTTAPKQIATPNQLATVIMGRLGKGFADRANLIGAIVDRGYDYTAADNVLNEHLDEMVRTGLIERVELPSTYALGQFYPVWRLPSSTPMESPAVPEESSATRPGHISAADYMRSGAKNTQRKRK